MTTVSTDRDDLLSASIDTLSPFTIIDRSTIGTPPGEITREVLTFEIKAAGSGGDAGLVTRARFSNVEALALHPCQREPDVAVTAECRAGLGANAPVIQSIVGADLLARNAVRFAFDAAEMSFFPDIAGDDAQRGAMCEAIFNQPFQGGGTAIIGGAEVNVTGRRIAIDACFFPPDQTEITRPTGIEDGVASLFVVSTGLAVTIVNQTTYERYRSMLGGSPPAFVDLPQSTLYLPSGGITAGMARMNRLALVAEISDERGPCEERYANDFLTENEGCEDPQSETCPCTDNSAFCRAGAVAEMNYTDPMGDDHGFDVAVVPDDDNTLQALRNELRPESPEVSGILGANALRALVMDVDYPNGRVLLRCATPTPADHECSIRPQILSESNLQLTKSCP